MYFAKLKSGALRAGLLLSLGWGVVPFVNGCSSANCDQADSFVNSQPSSRELPPFTTKEHFRFYVHTTFAPFAFVGPIAGGALNQWITGNPQEWGQGFPGYGRRLLSGYSRQVIANSVALGIAFAADEDPRHFPTRRQGVWRRGLYAARETFVSHRVSGGEMPAYSRIIGAYRAAFIANSWYPARESNARYALYRGSTALASNMVWQLFKEFWPDVRHKLQSRRRLRFGSR